MNAVGTEEAVQSAVLFFEGARVSRQLKWSEFQAYLDGYLGIPELARQQVRAVYMEIDGQLNILAQVFFTIGFDREGVADGRWNLPVEKLAKDARSRSCPDQPGSVTQSLCSKESYRQGLWEPELAGPDGLQTKLNALIRKNTLKLSVTAPNTQLRTASKPAEDLPLLVQLAPGDGSDDRDVCELEAAVAESCPELTEATDQQQRIEVLLRLQYLQKLRIEELEDETSRYQQDLEAAREQRSESEALAERIKSLNEQLRSRVRVLTDAVEVGQATEQQLAGLLDRIDQKNHEIGELRDEIARMKADMLKPRNDDDASILGQLGAQKIFLTAYQPGAGHIHLRHDQLIDYLRNPAAYAARKCGIEEEAYRRWLVHFENPVCNCGDVNCRNQVQRVEVPAQFEAGLHDRCEIHRLKPVADKAPAMARA